MLSALTIDNSCACYCPFLKYLKKRVLPTSRDVISKGCRKLTKLDNVIQAMEYVIIALPWFTRYSSSLTQVPHAWQESLQALSDIQPTLQGFLCNIKTVHGNLVASLLNPPDLMWFMSLIQDMEESFLLLDEKILQNTRTFIITSSPGPQQGPSIPPPTVLWDIITLGLWCPSP